MGNRMPFMGNNIPQHIMTQEAPSIEAQAEAQAKFNRLSLQNMVEDPDFFKMEAKIIWQRYEAFIETGFTKEEALQLITGGKK